MARIRDERVRHGKLGDEIINTCTGWISSLYQAEAQPGTGGDRGVTRAAELSSQVLPLFLLCSVKLAKQANLVSGETLLKTLPLFSGTGATIISLY